MEKLEHTIEKYRINPYLNPSVALAYKLASQCLDYHDLKDLFAEMIEEQLGKSLYTDKEKQKITRDSFSLLDSTKDIYELSLIKKLKMLDIVGRKEFAAPILRERFSISDDVKFLSDDYFRELAINAIAEIASTDDFIKYFANNPMGDLIAIEDLSLLETLNAEEKAFELKRNLMGIIDATDYLEEFASFVYTRKFGIGFVPFVVNIKMMDGSTMQLDVEPDDTIELLSFRIYEKTNILPETFRLLFGSKELLLIHTLSDYKIKNGDTITMTGRLRGGGDGEDIQSVELQALESSSEFNELIAQFMGNNYGILKIGVAMKECLIKLRVLKDVDCYHDVTSNQWLMSFLLKRIGTMLSDKVETSFYGCGVVSDFDLFINMSTDPDFNDLCPRFNVELDSPLYIDLKKKRTNLRRWVGRLRDQLVHSFGLPETPDSRDARRQLKTKEEVRKEELEKLAKKVVGDGKNDTTLKPKKKAKIADNTKQGVDLEAKKKNDEPVKFLGRRSGSKSNLLDLYETEQPDIIIDYLYSFLFKHNLNLLSSMKIWECCCGKTLKMYDSLKKIGFDDVIKSDIVQYPGIDFRYDVLNENGDSTFEKWDMIVTNPPFSKKKEFLQFLYSQLKPFAVLLPMSVINTKYAKEIFKEKYCIVLPITPKVTFKHDGKSVQVGEIGWFLGNVDNLVSFEKSIFNLSIVYVDRTNTKADYASDYYTTDGGEEDEGEEELL